MQYVGSTTSRFRTTFNNLKSKLNAMRDLSLEARSIVELVYQHFFLGAHRGLDDVELKIIDKGPSEVLLREREAQWVDRLRSLSPLGLNVDDFFIRKKKR